MHDRIEPPEHAAVLHLLSPALCPRTAASVNVGGFDWRGLFAEAQTMSGGEALLVRIAHELWSASKGRGAMGGLLPPRRAQLRAPAGRRFLICRGMNVLRPAAVSPLRLAV